MKHEVAAPMIGDLLQGRLTGEIHNEVLSHVTSCEECRSLSETYGLLSEAFADDREHVSVDQIVQYVFGEESLDPEERERIATHLLGCEACASEMEVTSKAETELAAETAPRQKRSTPVLDRRSMLAPALAAAVVLAVLAYPTYLGIFEVPRIDHRLAVLEAEQASRDASVAPGPFELAFLRSPVRDAVEEPETIEIPEGRDVIPLGVVPGMLEDYAGSGTVYLDVRDGSGRTTWSLELAESELSDAFLVLVPSDRLPNGELTLTVSRGAGRAEVVYQTPFVVTRAE